MAEAPQLHASGRCRPCYRGNCMSARARGKGSDLAAADRPPGEARNSTQMDITLLRDNLVLDRAVWDCLVEQLEALAGASKHPGGTRLPLGQFHAIPRPSPRSAPSKPQTSRPPAASTTRYLRADARSCGLSHRPPPTARRASGTVAPRSGDPSTDYDDVRPVGNDGGLGICHGRMERLLPGRGHRVRVW